MSDRTPEQILRDARAPGERESEERAWKVVSEAYERRLVTLPRRRPRLAIALAAAGAGLLVALTPAGAKVGELVEDIFTVGPERARPALSSLPAPGRLLVTSEQGAWVVHEDGSKRLLGDYSQATWSPNGLYVAAVTGRQLVAVEPAGGTVRWTVTRPEPVTDARWSPSGYRVAYRSRREIRVVDGDGTGDRRLAGDVAPVAPAWQPVTKAISPSGIGSHRLAYADRRGRIELRDTDAGDRLWRTGPGPRPVALEWTFDGRSLLAVDPGGYRVFDAMGRLVDRVGGQPAGRAATYRPGTTALAFGRRGRSEDGGMRTSVGLRRFRGSDPPVEPLLGVPGRITSLTWSPNGRWLLAAWEDADQWLFLRPSAPPRQRASVAFDGISRLFDPGGTGQPVFPRVEGWCCAG
jgi:WD40 repeat protein